ncbi:opsin-VA-like [Tubulanus polymorphus]|uniref:opsin-VA-like n=1 Tax=Tubulanus polymorphus TaxID=672921 RepID=UPI003DA26D98
MFSYSVAVVAFFNNGWPKSLGETGCTINGFSGFLFGIASLWTLAAISKQRYDVICGDMKRGRMKTVKKRIYRNIALIWFYALVWAALPASGWSRYAIEPMGTACSVDWFNPNPVNLSFIAVMFVGCFLVPFSVLVFFYTSIFLKIRQRAKNNRQPESTAYKKWKAIQSRMSRMSLLMVASYFICWTPYAIFSLMGVLGAFQIDNLSAEITALAPLLAKSCTIANPIIYAACNSKLRVVILHILRIRRDSTVDVTDVTVETADDLKPESVQLQSKGTDAEEIEIV